MYQAQFLCLLVRCWLRSRARLRAMARLRLRLRLRLGLSFSGRFGMAVFGQQTILGSYLDSYRRIRAGLGLWLD